MATQELGRKLLDDNKPWNFQVPTCLFSLITQLQNVIPII